ncbi:alpha-amylase family glycosyl hydrolase [Alteromonas ponticola]|uniref:Alpha-amylase n=1 Tax=Alteromonas ponticola TaxID=2720613 RepID=A0ABX1QXV5_9ALTE|nr:alpha-amylase family glycosyl hydrolase [Alteromonas ponticola]NMH58526.1 alpha-amylase [Alteromonas ponticola]
MRRLTVLVTLLASFTLHAQAKTTESLAAYQPEPYVHLTHPEWAKNASIYQINTRQFTPEGTFKAAQKQLPRLKELGVDILWLMPIHPIGEKNRKGSLGSPYSVKDYFAVNPEFGTADALKQFIDEAHALGMYVILDWVANHTAWNSDLVEKHPDWYERDYDGNFRPTPWWDWSDIIDLDYSKPEVRQYMTRALKFWVEEFDVDGYRADVAGFVPIEFWNNVRKELDAIKPVFMLAEWESRDLHARAFDMTYAWSWHEAIMHVIKHEGDMSKLFVYYSWNESAYPKDAYRMTYVSNHDANAWEGTMYERLGDGVEAALVLSFIGEGMPLIYNGVEAGNDKRLAFFEKDPIQWKSHHFAPLISKLNTVLKQNPALWHGKDGATMWRVNNSASDQVLSFIREQGSNKVFALFNFTSTTIKVSFNDKKHFGSYTDLNGKKIKVDAQSAYELKPWEYRVMLSGAENQ